MGESLSSLWPITYAIPALHGRRMREPRRQWLACDPRSSRDKLHLQLELGIHLAKSLIGSERGM